MERCAPSLNRYPDGGAFYLRRALAERHGVGAENVITAAGADAIVGHLSLATLDPGDEIVTGWPSFISYVLDALKLGAVPRKVPLRDHHYDLDALLAGDRAAHEARLHRDAEQPDRDDDDAGRARRLLRARARARAHGARPGVLRVHRPPGLPGRDRGVREGGPPRARPAHVLEDLRPRGAAHRLRRRAAGRDPGDRQDAPRRSTSTRQAQVAALASLDERGGARAPPRG